MRRYWNRFMGWWMPIAEIIGNFMNRVILSLFYFVIVLPFGVGVRLFSDPLRIKKAVQSGWSKSSHRVDTIDQARKQF